MRTLLKHRLISSIFLILSLVYLGISTFSKPDPATLTKYHITSAKLTAIVLTISLPYIVIWVVALIGYIRFNTYVDLIKRSKDGAAFKTMSHGLLLLAAWLPVSAVASSVATNVYQKNPGRTAAMIILVNYINILLLLPGYALLYRGARKLLPLVKTSAATLSQSINVAFISFASAYTFVTLEDPARHMATSGVPVAAYYLPDWLIIFTLVIPRLIMWYLGVKAVQYLYLYRNKVRGVLYKQALDNLARGFGGVVLITIILRIIQSLSTPLSKLSLAALLGIIYVLLIMIAVGYGFIASGAKKLQQIEEL